MNAASKHLEPAPSTMAQADFVRRFGTIYEHSPWVAERAWQNGLTAGQDNVAGLAAAMAEQVDSAPEAQQMELIRAHPDLGGKAAQAGRLTADSSREQAGAGLDACTPEQYERLQRLNTAYTEKFGFPFIIAVKGLQREDILAAMAERLANDAATERRAALAQIHRIARLRLTGMAG